MQDSETKKRSLEEFENRVQLVSAKGPLLAYSLAVYLSGLSRARLRQLVETGKIETEKINGQLMIVLPSLAHYRRAVLATRVRKIARSPIASVVPEKDRKSR